MKWIQWSVQYDSAFPQWTVRAPHLYRTPEYPGPHRGARDGRQRNQISNNFTSDAETKYKNDLGGLKYLSTTGKARGAGVASLHATIPIETAPGGGDC